MSIQNQSLFDRVSLGLCVQLLGLGSLSAQTVASSAEEPSR